ncbi:uncharacterized protein BDZ99DRAFT_509836 [Mytilinidion resinicola]|uniref:PQ loop repeat protein n=1 Tax=Mytilinidion resinicola TaxID=574789 RepID=A0A6A6YFL8_9PEZI|nr:uncharacterized protein BDZ99DRAFT_509836 [Mytilinidion resinicola]KAF2807601.1 hypothetical protein BDZ99DRAFT_509836 [Mytilinidion resinicola]
MDAPVAANVLGTIGAICWSVQLIPQTVINYRRHNATGLQPTMMMMWAWAGVPLGVYNVVKNSNTALQVQPQILTFLKLKWSVLRALAVVVPIALFMGGLEAALIIALRISHSRDVQWPITLMAILSAILLAAGVLGHYWDIYVHRTVRGICLIFVGIDAAGDAISLVSVLFQPEMDVLGLIIYGTEFVLRLGVFACGGYFNLVPWMHAKIKKKTSSRPNTVPLSPSRCSQSSAPAAAMALHNLPSSTCVFRTPSVEIWTARARTGPRRSNTDGVGDEPSAGG